jgi:hypothetical protein
MRKQYGCIRDAGKQAYEYDVTSIDDRFIRGDCIAMAQRRVGDIPALENVGT